MLKKYMKLMKLSIFFIVILFISCVSGKEIKKVEYIPIELDLKISPETESKYIGENTNIKLRYNVPIKSCSFFTSPPLFKEMVCNVNNADMMTLIEIKNLQESFNYWFEVIVEEQGAEPNMKERDIVKSEISKESKKGNINVISHPSYLKGKELGINYKQEKIKDFQVAVATRELFENKAQPVDKEQFIKGFVSGYGIEEASEYAKIFIDSVSSREYTRGLEISKKFAKKEISEVQVYEIVHQSLTLPIVHQLSFKAGFIQGVGEDIGIATYNAFSR